MRIFLASSYSMGSLHFGQARISRRSLSSGIAYPPVVCPRPHDMFTTEGDPPGRPTRPSYPRPESLSSFPQCEKPARSFTLTLTLSLVREGEGIGAQAFPTFTTVPPRPRGRGDWCPGFSNLHDRALSSARERGLVPRLFQPSQPCPLVREGEGIGIVSQAPSPSAGK